MTTDPQVFYTDGCGRCPLGGTPGCKVHAWRDVLAALRAVLLLDGALQETAKWGVPCFVWQGRNVALLGAFSDHAAVSFFKGALLDDPQGILQAPGPNTQAARVARFTTTEQVAASAPALRACLRAAIAAERAGLSVAFKPTAAYPVPDALQRRLDADPLLRTAFEALTPGRQRSYLLHIGSAKQEKTREARVEQCVPRILAGKGFHDR